MSSSPNPTNIAEPVSISGEVQSAILSKEEPVPDDLDDDEDDDVVVSKRRGGQANGVHGVDLEDKMEDEDDGDLFGDEPEEDRLDEAPVKRRQLGDEELDSGDDIDREDRIGSRTPIPEVEPEKEEEYIMVSEIPRQPEPQPSDGEMYLLKVPNFLTIEPNAFESGTFGVPEREHHSREAPPATFSALDTALSTIRWRHSPSDPAELQSNARILRWSDGSLTLQLASDPTQQYEIDGNALAPTQKNPLKPTPITRKPKTTAETYTYLTVPHETVGLLRVTHKITAGLSVLPSAKTTDDALVRLQRSLAAAAQGKSANTSTGIEMVPISEDPELGRKKAELAEKEKQRAQKRREAAENRDKDRSSRALGRAGLSSSRYGAGGLSASMLEDDEGGAGAAPRQRAKPKSRRARNDEYSSDEDLGRRRGNFANDDYEVDDFVAGSDEEEELEEEEEEEEEEDIDEGIDRKKLEKRSRVDEEQDAAGEEVEEEEDEDEVRAAPKAKRRRAVVDEDEDDE